MTENHTPPAQGDEPLQAEPFQEEPLQADQSLTRESLTRRQVLTTAVKTAGAGLLLLLPMARETARADAAPKKAAAKKTTPKKAAPKKPAAPAPDLPDTTGWAVLGTTAQFIQDRPQRTALPDGGVLYVTRLTNTTLAAVSARCTHRGCEVGWNADTKQLLCPCHGAAFESGGKTIHGTTRRPDEALPPLPSVPVVEKKGQVFANLKAASAPELIPGH